MITRPDDMTLNYPQMPILEVIGSNSETLIDGTLRILCAKIISRPRATIELHFIIQNHTASTWSANSASGLNYIVSIFHLSAPEQLISQQSIPLACEIPPMRPLLQRISIDAPAEPANYSIEVNLGNINAASPFDLNLKRWVKSLTIEKEMHTCSTQRANEIYNRVNHLSLNKTF
jgi:hypothetical protein